MVLGALETDKIAMPRLWIFILFFISILYTCIKQARENHFWVVALFDGLDIL